MMVRGTITVSPKFIISAHQMRETFGDVFDAETFDSDISARMFSFNYSQKKNLKIDSEKFEILQHEVAPEKLIERTKDQLEASEEIKTALIFGPQFSLYPISLDRFLHEILDREFRIE